MFAVVAHAETDKRADSRTDTVPFHRPCSAYRAGSVSDVMNRNWRSCTEQLGHFASLTSCSVGCIYESEGGSFPVSSIT